MITVRLKTPNNSSVVSLEEFKTFASIDFNDDNELIESFLKSADAFVSSNLNRALLTTVYVMQWDSITVNSNQDPSLLNFGLADRYYADDFLQLYYPPIASVVSFRYYGDDNTSKLFASSSYRLDGSSGRIYLNDGYTWPEGTRERQVYEVEYSAGYGDHPNSVPQLIKTAIKILTNILYDSRGACEMNISSVDGLLAPYRFYGAL